jgi:hypothetical protein
MARQLLRDLARYDPTTFVGSFAFHSLAYGVSLAAPWPAFGNQVYATLRDGAVSETAWGVVMLTVGVLLLSSLIVRRLPYRAAVAVIAGAVWAYFGSHMLAGAYLGGFFSAGGAYAVAGSLGCLLAAPQWVGRDA